MAAPGMQDTTPLLLLPSQTITATGNSASFTLPQAEAYALYLVVSAAAGSGTLAPILQTSLDNGVTWVNTGIAFATTGAAPASQGVVFKPTMGVGQNASVIAPVSGTASAVNQPINRKFMRLASTVTGTSVTFALYGLAAPKGYSVV